MKKVLLAVVGNAPDPTTFRYAEQLSRRIQAELDVLQLVRPRDARPKPAENPAGKYELATSGGNPGAEIADYIHRHRNVVFAIYDAASAPRRARRKLPKLSVPLVVRS
jgi:hypothetical protein